jgi:hypothetical protein
MDMNIAHTTNNTVRQHTEWRRKPNKCDNSGAYWIKYLDCPLLYVGQTGRFFQTRYKDHIRLVISNQHNSNYASHILNRFGRGVGPVVRQNTEWINEWIPNTCHTPQTIHLKQCRLLRIIYKCNGKSHIYRAIKNKVHLNESHTCIRCANTRLTLGTVPSFNKTKSGNHAYIQSRHSTLKAHLR